VDVALRLFLTEGYRATTIGRLLKEAGLSRGAFYHHFESKDEVMEAAVEVLGREGLESLEEEVRNAAGPVVGVQRLLGAGPGWWPSSLSTLGHRLRALYRPDSAPLRERIALRTRGHLLPLLAPVLEAGEDDGLFRLPGSPVQVAEHFLLGRQALLAVQIASLVGESDAPSPTLYDLVTRADVFTGAAERSLGVEEGALGGILRPMTIRLHRALGMPTGA
jgi:AcrR family transcriptional regulator